MKCGVLIFGLSMPIVIIIIIIQGNFIENRTICKQIAAAKVLLLFVNTVCDVTVVIQDLIFIGATCLYC